MIVLKTSRELAKMREAGKIAGRALQLAGKACEAGISTAEINAIAERFIRSCGAKPSFKGLYGFPATACISVNEQVIHGIPSKNCILKPGDIVSIDLGAFYEGYHGDTAATFTVGQVDPNVQRLIDVTTESLFKGISQALTGNRVGDISHAVQTCVEENGFSVVRDFVGHGVGTELHESPEVPNFGSAARGVRLMAGMTIAIEPMVNMGDFRVKVLDDDWTVVTVDKSMSAHFEHTIAITNDGPVVLTEP
ncbi:MAG: type I methionyl aminopeptidase [Clostridia bacterium]|nr:type I methionyl aminopeptidase [Clostridia bacterium]